jgi:hypothetical protein
VIRRLLAAIRRPSGGTMPTHKPSNDSVPVILSPGWVPPEMERYLPREVLDRINSTAGRHGR